MILFDMSLQVCIGGEACLLSATTVYLAAKGSVVKLNMLLSRRGVGKTFVKVVTDMSWAFEEQIAIKY
jgi:hypothetical protein